MTQTDKKLWFKRRRHGSGWMPVTWQGWVSLVVLLGIPIAATMIFHLKQSDAGLGIFYVLVIVDLTILIALCMKKGPAPRWRWGKKPDDDPDEDF